MKTYLRLTFDNASFPDGICDVFRKIMNKRRYKDFEFDIFYGGIVIAGSPYVYSEKDKSEIIIKTVGIAVEFRYAIKELKRRMRI